MTDPSNVALPVEIIPSREGEVSGIASAHAPFLFFDLAPAFGHRDGVVQITLTATRTYPTITQKPGNDHVIVAHLRMSVPAAHSLKAALDGALLLATPAQTEAKN